MEFVAIDFEASCLPRHGLSFPIEVGIFDGSASKSWLIQPHGDWANWHWSVEAETLHGIKRDEIVTRGLPAAQVMEELLRAVGGRRLVADSHIDQYWLDTLAAAARHDAVPTIDHVARLLEQWKFPAAQVFAAKDRADRLQPRRHRAAHDAHWLGLVLMDLSARAEDVAVAA